MSAADLIRSRMNWDGLFETEEDTACENSGETNKSDLYPILRMNIQIKRLRESQSFPSPQIVAGREVKSELLLLALLRL